MKATAVLACALALAPATVYGALDASIKAKGKQYFGTCLDPNTINNSGVSALAKSEFGQVTPENSAKWDAIQPNQGQFNFGNFDTLVNWAKANNKTIRGHTFAWHSQLPQWVKNINNAATLTTVLQNHITTVMTRYKGQILHWDVANEVVNDGASTLRSSVFYNVLGESFLDIAFKAARAADPNAKLYLNDYSIDFAGAKLTGFINLVNRLKSRGVPIDGVGTQAHLIAGQVGGFASATQQLHNLGLDVAITELDIRIAKPVTSAGLSQQQADYNTVVKTCMNLPRCVGITTWGVSDNFSWVDGTFPSYDSPLLWNDSLQKKPAYTGVEQAISGSSGSSTGGSNSTSTTTTTTTSTSSGGCTVPLYGQCGGSGYTGCTTCASGSTCKFSNEWYSQCL